MSKTKQKIVRTALSLFNELGYKEVTIRMIALKLEMSSGNLNYHFKKREDILEALYFQMVQAFDERIDNLSETEISFEQIKSDIQRSMERMVEYKFIWTDLYSILRGHDRIFNHFSGVYQDRIAGNLFLFNRLHEMVLMRSEVFKTEYAMLAERMINYGDTWIYSSEVYRREHTKKEIESQSASMLSMLYPYLTDKGAEQYSKVK
jgi:AcrR family transcriptional regulator